MTEKSKGNVLAELLESHLRLRLHLDDDLVRERRLMDAIIGRLGELPPAEREPTLHFHIQRSVEVLERERRQPASLRRRDGLPAASRPSALGRVS